MSEKDTCAFKVPVKSKRNLNSLYNELGDQSPSFGKTLKKSFKGSAAGSNSFEACHTRVTRNSMKQWQQMYGHVKHLEKGGVSMDSGEMKPPPPLHTSRNSSGGMITRFRSRTKNRESSHPSDLCHHLRVLCLRNGPNVSSDCKSNTSEYGTASEDSKNNSLGQELSPRFSSGDSCHCDSVSGVGSLLSDTGDEELHDELSGDLLKAKSPSDLTNFCWDSDCTDSGQCALQHSKEWDADAEKQYFQHLRESVNVRLITSGQVTALIPNVNCSGYQGHFKINLKTGEEYNQGISFGMRIHHVSPVVSMEPHGVQFYRSFPALLIISLSVEPQNEAWLSCLCSNTSEGQPPSWKRLPKRDYTYRNGFLVITASHFSLFTVILEEPFPEVMKRIHRRRGGRLYLDEVPGVEVNFPRGCLDEDVDAYLRVLFDNEPPVSPNDRVLHRRQALASPVIMLGPHGHQFSSQNRKPVFVQLPVPDYHAIIARFGAQARLSVWQSCTGEREPMVWKRMDVQLQLPTAETTLHFNGYSLAVVTFPVHHFSFFKVVWDILASSLYEAKMGMSYFYPYISFSMMCQAFMEESSGSRFGLEVICYRSDKTLPETTNYKYRVGASLKPKLVRPGRILVRLRSQMFEADVEAGEDKEMEKIEPDFRGRDFEKQYALRFKPDVNVDRGTFGKVIVERILTAGKDPLFEFNLHKTGMESEVTLPVGCERWTVFAMKELASSLQITDGNNWKKFAQYIGFTKNEIKCKLKYSDDPFLTMMNMYNGRGGTPEEFIQALYAVSRDLRLNNSGMTGSNRGDSSSHSGGSRESDGQGSSSQDSGVRHATKRLSTLWNFRLWNKDNSDSDSPPSERQEPKSRKRPLPSSNKKSKSGGGSGSKRRKFSDISETISSSSDEDDNEPMHGSQSASTEKHRNNPRKLNDQDLWNISAKIVRKDWRNLGRSLGIEEQALVNLEHSYQSIGFRECAYQMLLEWKGRKPRKCTFGELYTALIRENMDGVAKHMVHGIAKSNENRDKD